MLRMVMRASRLSRQPAQTPKGSGGIFAWPLGLVTLPLALFWPFVFWHGRDSRLTAEVLWIALLALLAYAAHRPRRPKGRPARAASARPPLAVSYRVLRRVSLAGQPDRYGSLPPRFSSLTLALRAAEGEAGRALRWQALQAAGFEAHASYLRADGARVTYGIRLKRDVPPPGPVPCA
jgi:hypothetical protein